MKRAFRGLRWRQEPDAHYDAVIIGAGIGGLICGNLLAREGLRVLLVEQHYMVGGYCSTFRRRGYTFDAASHFYPLLGNPTTITGKLLVELGVECDWIKMDPVDHFHLPDGTRFSVPADFGEYRQQLNRLFPAEIDNLDRFFSVVREVYMLGLLQYFRRRKTGRIAAFEELTLRQALDEHFSDRRLKLLLAADCAHWGSPPSRTSFVFDSMLRLSYFLGNYYPRGGSQAFSDALAKGFEDRGGHILMQSTVRRILIENETACGVEVMRGSVQSPRLATMRAEAVISNADLRLTLEQMVGPSHLDASYLQSVRCLRATAPCFLTHLGLAGVSTEDLQRIQGYYWDDWDSDRVGRGGLRFKLFVPTLYEPAMAPPGGHVLIVQKVVEMDYDGVADWPGHKAEIERKIRSDLDAVLPGVVEKAVVNMCASAKTSHRFTQNFHGAMLGWEMAPDQLGDARPDIQAPVGNLYFAGHWVRPGGGITPVIASSMQAAEAVLGGSSPTNGAAVPRLEEVFSP